MTTEIRFTTALDNSKFDAAAKDLTKTVSQEMNRMTGEVMKFSKASLSSFGKSTQRDIENLTVALARKTEQVRNTVDKLEELGSEYDKIANKEVAPKEALELTRELEKKTNSLSKTEDRITETLQKRVNINKELHRLENMARVSEDNRKKLQSNIDEVEIAKQTIDVDVERSKNRVKELKNEIESIKKSIVLVSNEPMDNPSVKAMESQMQSLNRQMNVTTFEARTIESRLSRAFDGGITKSMILGATLEYIVPTLGRMTSSAFGFVSKLASSNPIIKRIRDGLSRSTDNMKEFEKTTRRSHSTLGKVADRVKRIAAMTLFYNVFRTIFSQMRIYMRELVQSSQELTNSFATLGFYIEVAFQPIWQTVLPYMQKLVDMLAYAAAYAAKLMSVIFGISLEGSKGAVKASKETTDGLKQQAKGYKDTAKAAKDASKQIQGFDQLNIMADKDKGKPSAPSVPGGAGGVDIVGPSKPVIQEIEIDETKFMRQMKDVLSQIGEVFSNAWSNEGQATIDAMKGALNGVKDLVISIGDSFLKVFTGGSGQRIIESMLRTLQNMFETIENLAGSIQRAWESNDAGTRLLQTLADLLEIVTGHFETFTEKLAKWVGELDFSPMMEAFITLADSFKDFADVAGEAMLWLWDEILQPFLTWFIQELYPKLTELKATLLDLVTEVAKALGPLAEDILENLIKPLSGELGDGIINGIDNLMERISELTTWISENGDKFREFVVDGAKVAGIVATIAGGVKLKKSATDGYKKFIDDNVLLGVVLSETGDKVKDFGSRTMGSLDESGDSFKKWFKNFDLSKLKDKIPNLASDESGFDISGMADPITKGLGKFVNRIKDSFKALSGDNVGDGFGTMISTIGDKLITLFGNLKTGFGKILSGIGKFLSGLNPIVVIIALVIAAVTDLMLRSEEFRERVGETLEGLKETLTLLWENVLEPIFTYVKEVATELWEELQPMWEAIRDAIGQFIIILLDLWDNALKPIVDFIIEHILPILLKVGKFLMDVLLVAVKAVVKGIKLGAWMIEAALKIIRNIVDTVLTFVKEKIEWVVDKFTAVWKPVAKIFKGPIKEIEKAWNGLLDFFNGLFDSISNIVSKIFGKKNEAESAERDTYAANAASDNPYFTNTASVNRLSGMRDLSKVSRARPDIPMLAKGGLIPPRKPRQVIVGDNRHEDEIVSPVSTMKGAVMEAMMELGGSGGSSNAELLNMLNSILHAIEQGQTIELNQRELGRTVVKSVSDARRQTGTQLF